MLIIRIKTGYRKTTYNLRAAYITTVAFVSLLLYLAVDSILFVFVLGLIVTLVLDILRQETEKAYKGLLYTFYEKLAVDILDLFNIRAFYEQNL